MRILLAALLILCSLSVFSQVQIVLDVFPPTCEGCCDGEVNMSVEGCMVGAYSYLWTGPAGSNSIEEDLSNICETGVYVVNIADENDTQLEVTFDIIIGEAPFTLIENFTIDCVSGGGNLSDCLLWFFPPDSLQNGELCVAPPPCWNPKFIYLWYDAQGNIIGTSECISGLPAGDYAVEVSSSAGEFLTMEVSLVQGADPGMISQEVCPPNGLSESESMEFELYPNPAKDHILLSIDDAYAGLRFRIADLQGREVMVGRLNSLSTTIDLSALRAGSYLISVIDGVGKVMGAERLLRE